MPRFAVRARPKSVDDLERLATMLEPIPGASRFIDRDARLEIATVVDAPDAEGLANEILAVAVDSEVAVRSAALSQSAHRIIAGVGLLGPVTREDVVDAPLLQLLSGARDDTPIVETIVTATRERRVPLPLRRRFVVVTAGLSADPARSELSMHTDDVPALYRGPAAIAERIAAHVARIDRIYAGVAAEMLRATRKALDDAHVDGEPPATISTSWGEARFSVDDELARVGVRARRVRIETS